MTVDTAAVPENKKTNPAIVRSKDSIVVFFLNIFILIRQNEIVVMLYDKFEK